MSSMYMPDPTIAYTAARLDRKVGGADSNGKDPGARERVLLSRSRLMSGGSRLYACGRKDRTVHSLSYSRFLCLPLCLFERDL